MVIVVDLRRHIHGSMLSLSHGDLILYFVLPGRG